MEDELIRQMIYYRGVNKLTKAQFAKMLNISVNTLNNILNQRHVKETTKIYVFEKFKKIRKEGEE